MTLPDSLKKELPGEPFAWVRVGALLEDFCHLHVTHDPLLILVGELGIGEAHDGYVILQAVLRGCFRRILQQQYPKSVQPFGLCLLGEAGQFQLYAVGVCAGRGEGDVVILDALDDAVVVNADVCRRLFWWYSGRTLLRSRPSLLSPGPP